MDNDEHKNFQKYMAEQSRTSRLASQQRLRHQTVQGPKERKGFAMTLCLGNAIGTVKVA